MAVLSNASTPTADRLRRPLQLVFFCIPSSELGEPFLNKETQGNLYNASYSYEKLSKFSVSLFIGYIVYINVLLLQ